MWKLFNTLLGCDDHLCSTLDAAHEAVRRAEKEIAATLGVEICPLHYKPHKKIIQEEKKRANGMDRRN